ncbi:colicin immunity protein Cui, partial [Salmonella enterica subsp. enterica serovar Typhimurium]|nr:colicin immunity protein Cui [Salmonella enterica subsp. enterica serovar Typhimurium]
LTDTELTLSSKTFVLMSKNDLFLSFFYITLYIGIYIFTYLYFWFLIGTYKLFTRGGILP